jgi:hypothetical protein
MKKWLILLLVFGILFQVIGFLSVIFSFIIYQFLGRFGTKNHSIELFKKMDAQGDIFNKLDEVESDISQEIFDIQKIDSYKDILYFGTENDKIDLIGMVVFNPTKEFISLIKIALNDKNETVRILASNSLQKFENFFEDKIHSLKKDLKSKNDNKIYLELIKVYDRYIESTLLDSFLHSKYINEIFELFKKIKNIKEDELIYKSYLKLSIKYNKFNDLEDKLIYLIKDYPTCDNLFMIIEYYYKKSDFENIYKYLELINPKNIKSTKQKNSYDFWINHAI